ncbi:hypothetical protein TGVEG_441560 [Toxoplasma gondii VEG]|uniref:Uncharacterized protein n=1 Tax=Toxoplasma gondii (strain ATCC 50861 / VEG) TaxID=432359 RepID=V5B0K3_TOXGV|nr:hypothetical protein TGVEG_441560 [Toxoplasma gondii VEG]
MKKTRFRFLRPLRLLNCLVSRLSCFVSYRRLSPCPLLALVLYLPTIQALSFSRFSPCLSEGTGLLFLFFSLSLQLPGVSPLRRSPPAICPALSHELPFFLFAPSRLWGRQISSALVCLLHNKRKSPFSPRKAPYSRLSSLHMFLRNSQKRIHTASYNML